MIKHTSFKTVIRTLFIFLTLTSCKDKNTNDLTKGNKNEKLDTLILTEDFLMEKDSTRNLIKLFKHKTKTKLGLPTNEKVHFTLVFKNNFLDVVKHTNIELLPLTKNFTIKKLDNYNYELFIRPETNDRIISMSLMLSPKKNYVLKTYFETTIVKFPKKTEVCQLNQIISEN